VKIIFEPTEVVSSDQIGTIVDLKPDALNSLLSGIYTTMYTAGSGGTDHDDFGQKDMIFIQTCCVQIWC
jgi:hypothetical protein